MVHDCARTQLPDARLSGPELGQDSGCGPPEELDAPTELEEPTVLEEPTALLDVAAADEEPPPDEELVETATADEEPPPDEAPVETATADEDDAPALNADDALWLPDCALEDAVLVLAAALVAPEVIELCAADDPEAEEANEEVAFPEEEPDDEDVSVEAPVLLQASTRRMMVPNKKRVNPGRILVTPVERPMQQTPLHHGTQRDSPPQPEG